MKKKKARKPKANRAMYSATSRRPAGLAPEVAAANIGTFPIGSIRANMAMKKLTPNSTALMQPA